MTKLKEFYKPYLKELTLSPLFKLLEAVFELMIPLFMASLIDNGIAKSDYKYIIIMIFIMLALSVLGYLSALVCQIYASKSSCNIAYTLRKEIIKKFSKLSYAQLDDINSVNVNNMITRDIDNVQTAIAMILRLLVRAPFIVIGTIVLSAFININISLIFIVVSIIVSLIFILIIKYLDKVYYRVATIVEGIALNVKEYIEGILIIKTKNADKLELDKYRSNLEDYNNIGIKSSNINSLINPVNTLIVNIAIAVIIFMSYDYINVGSLTSGELVACVNYMLSLLHALIIGITLTVTISKGNSSANRIHALLSIESSNDISEYSDDSDYVIRTHDLSFKYKSNKKESIKNINIELAKHEILGVMGTIGSSKTTLLKLLYGLYPVDHNMISANVDINEIAYVEQNANLFKGSVKDNLLRANSKASIDDIKKALELAKCDFIKDIDYQLEKNGSNLSGGQRQRVSIARMFIKESELLLLDDVTSALDNNTCKYIMKSIKQLDKAAIIVSNKIEVINECTKILVLDEGRCVGYGTHDELINSSELYKEIYNSSKEGELYE